MKFSISFYLIVLVIALACVAATCEEESKQLESARSRFRLPKLFDFARYKELFKKSYASLVEELARQKIMLARAFASIVSMVKYKFSKGSHYRGVNQFSDRTQDELDELKIHSDVLRINGGGATPKIETETEPKSADRDAAASLEDIEQVIADIEQHKSEPGYRELAEEFERAQGSVRSKRSALQRARSTLSADDLMRSPEAKDEPASTKQKVSSNNPEYEPPELDSFGLDDGSAEQSSSMAGSVINLIGKFPGATYLKDMVSGAAQSFMYQTDDADMMDIDGDEYHDASDKLQDVVYFDHRDSGCFFLPRNQGRCGSCYAFASVAMFEWDFCRQTGNMVAFSEQFMVDCGYALGMNGCDGATVDQPSKFVSQFGFELRSDYPYRTKQDQCPYDAGTNTRSMGYIRYKYPGHILVRKSDIDSRLMKKPVLVGLMLPTDFSHYGGGIDEAADCSPNDGHAMLLVGAGREDGKEYYLIRNSHSIAWGEQGYWKLSKEAFNRCLLDGLGVITTGVFEKKDKQGYVKSNPLYAADPIKERYNSYLNSQVMSA